MQVSHLFYNSAHSSPAEVLAAESDTITLRLAADLGNCCDADIHPLIVTLSSDADTPLQLQMAGCLHLQDTDPAIQYHSLLNVGFWVESRHKR